MVVAGLLILVQRNLKRMMAYSSVEHMGIIAIGWAWAGAGLFGALLHIFNHSVGKSLLFFCAGNIRETSEPCAWTALAAWRARFRETAVSRWWLEPCHCWTSTVQPFVSELQS